MGPLQYSCLGNPMDRGAWRATVHRVTKNQIRLSDQHFHFCCRRQCCRPRGRSEIPPQHPPGSSLPPFNHVSKGSVSPGWTAIPLGHWKKQHIWAFKQLGQVFRCPELPLFTMLLGTTQRSSLFPCLILCGPKACKQLEGNQSLRGNTQ